MGKVVWLWVLIDAAALMGATLNGFQREIVRGSFDSVFLLLAVVLACTIAFFVAYRMLPKNKWIWPMTIACLFIGASSNGLVTEIVRGSSEHTAGLLIVQLVCIPGFFVAYRRLTKQPK